MNRKILLIITLIILVIGSAIVAANKLSKQDDQASTDINSDTPPGEALKTEELNKMLVALGSSLTRASNLSSNKQGENEEYSFSVGTKIESLYSYLKKQDKDLTFVNLASPGAETQDILERQLARALDYQPKYITMDPGADIVSKNPSVSRFKQNLSQIIEKINPATTIFLFNYPNFIKMRTASYTSCLENKTGVSLENLTENHVLAFNQTMKETIRGRSNVVFVDIYNLLGPEDISDYDCLHINISGQQKIAQEFIKNLNK